MIAATRRWLRRNRNGLAIAAGAIGATYLAAQYILGKISEAKERAALDRIAKDKYVEYLGYKSNTDSLPSLKRRFAQNQQDCTYTVLALLPTVTENVLSALPVEQFTQELQQKKQERLARASGEGAASEISSAPSSIVGADTASLSNFQTDSFIHASQFVQEGQHPRPRKTKVQLWNEIKIASISRAFTLIYTVSLLTLLTRIQLNLLGRLNYLTSVISLASPPTERSNSISLEDHDDSHLGSSANFGNDFETNRRYLTFSWFLLHRGYAKILEDVRAAVNEVFGGVSPTEALTARRLSDLTLEVRKKVEGATEQDRYATRWLPFMLPPRDEEESVLLESGVITPPLSSSARTHDSISNSGPNRSTPNLINTSSGPLRRLLDETADLIDSPTFTRIHTLILNTLFSHLIDVKVAEQVFPRPPEVANTDTTGRIQEVDSAVTVVPAEPRAKLATILAVLTRQAHAIGNNGSDPPNDYVQAVDRDVKELESFAAVIYANNLAQSVEESRPKTADSTLKSADGIAVTHVGIESEGEMLESKLEDVWSKVVHTSFSSR
jgi:peroxin-3